MPRYITINTLCERVGGDRPVHPSTVYRMIAKGLLPKPDHPTPGISRFDDDECEAAIARNVRENADRNPA